MSAYTKISIAISIEVFSLMFINLIIKAFVPEFDTGYIITAQLSLLVIQLIGVILQKKEHEEEMKEFFRRERNIYLRYFKM